MFQDVLYTVCNPIGSVLRIVIFKRNGIQAMVEYPYRVLLELLQILITSLKINVIPSLITLFH